MYDKALKRLKDIDKAVSHDKRTKILGTQPLSGRPIKGLVNTGSVDVGIIDSGKHSEGSDYTVAQIGLVHEFGAIVKLHGGKKILIPERSFMRSTLEENRSNLREKSKKAVRLIQKGQIDANTALALLGEFFADEISKKIVDIRSPPNAPATIKRKGFDNPLIETGQLKNSITYKVNRV